MLQKQTLLAEPSWRRSRLELRCSTWQLQQSCNRSEERAQMLESFLLPSALVAATFDRGALERDP